MVGGVVSTRSLRRVTEAELYALADKHNLEVSHDGGTERSLWIEGCLYVTTEQEHTR